MKMKLARISSDSEYYFEKAVHSIHKESPEKVLEYFDRAIAANPGNAMAWNEKANFLDFLGKCEDALAAYNIALKLDPELSEAWFNKGMTLKKMGKEREGIACIDKGIEFACGR
jgi:tetratricopeptide (TPR) repeat protein